MSRKGIIIGAGIAGLSAGCHLQMRGYRTEIFEQHDLPGGLCTSWKRKGFTVDGCIHWLVGSGPSDPFYPLWNELIDMNKVRFVDFDEYLRVETLDGGSLRVYADMDRLEEEMLQKAPEDGELIRGFIGAARKLAKMDLPIDRPRELYSFSDGLKMLWKVAPYAGTLKKWIAMSGRDLASRCRSRLLARTFESMFIPGMSALFLLFIVIWMHRRSAGYPVGGSLHFARLIEKRYRELGGTIRYRSPVREIAVSGGSACGVVCDDGSPHRSDFVLSAADGYSTLFRMLGGKFLSPGITAHYRHSETFPSYLQVSLGVAGNLEEEPHSVSLEPDDPIAVDRETTLNSLTFRIYSFDPTLAPRGKTVATAMLPTGNFSYWEELRQGNREQYRREKKRIADKVTSIFRKRFRVKKSAIVMTDVSTPATVMRYTGNWKGSYEGWLLSPRMGLRQMEKTLPGLANFSMAGHWVEPGGGLPSAMLSGRNAALLIAARDSGNYRT